jgi:hypothetical protein
LVRLLVAGGGEVVDEVAHLLGRHPDAGVDHRQLALPPARGVNALPVEVPDDAAGGVRCERRDRLEGVDGELAQALEV